MQRTMYREQCPKCGGQSELVAELIWTDSDVDKRQLREIAMHCLACNFKRRIPVFPVPPDAV